jgi:GntR family transcriptional regulator/MocR family aminotransferase
MYVPNETSSMKSVQGALLSSIQLDRNSQITLFQQLDKAMRKLILNGAVIANQRLPSSRQLADDLGVSRITVKNVYEQLIAEGYVYSKIGSGSFAAENLKREKSPRPNKRTLLKYSQRKSTPKHVLSEQSKRITLSKATTRIAETRSFRPGIPALDVFPRKLWNKYWKEVNTNCHDDSFGYGPTGGIPRLKNAIAAHLRDARSVNCDAEQIVITTGAQQAFVLIAFALINKDNIIWYEDPGHIAGRDAFHTMGAKICPVAIDEEGLDLDQAIATHPKPAVIFTTPSHQHPLGTTMSLVRRLQLLSYAHDNKSWIIEDDYDSEFQYRGRPLPALQALDDQGSVLYVGTFSKSLFPAVRLGYIIVPHDLVAVFSAAQSLLGQGASVLMQEVVSRFIEDGRFADHIRKMRVIYQRRRDVLTVELRRQCSDMLTPVHTDVGMHLIAWLSDGLDELKTHKALLELEIETIPLSIFSITPQTKAGLVLGFSGTAPDDIPPLVEKMANCLKSLLKANTT